MGSRALPCGRLVVVALGGGCARTDRNEEMVRAAMARDLPAVRRHLDAGVDPNATFVRPWPVGGVEGPALRIAAAAGDTAMVRLLLERRADLRAAEALHTAASYGRRDLV